MKSIMQEEDDICYLCGQEANYENGHLEEHHVFFGKGNRKKSEKYGLKVNLHAFKCHRLGPGSVHKNKMVRRALEAKAQEKFEEVHGNRELFYKEFGVNRL
jgi:hypothetical protein